MTVYKVIYEWQGYSRGTCIKFIVVPDNVGVAEYIEDNGWDEDVSSRSVTRDDTEMEMQSFEAVKGEPNGKT